MARRKSIYRNSRKKLLFAKRGLILCEGETEANYFKGLVTQEKYRRKFQTIDVEIYKPKNHLPLGLIETAIKKIKEAKRDKNSYDFAWVVCDKDQHPDLPKAFEMARSFKPEIKIAFVVPCFEYFVLLHFEKTTKPFSSCDSVISYLKTKHISDYEKANNIFELLFPKKEIGLANSKWVSERFLEDIEDGKKLYDLSAYSNVHKLVNYLYSLIPAE